MSDPAQREDPSSHHPANHESQGADGVSDAEDRLRQLESQLADAQSQLCEVNGRCERAEADLRAIESRWRSLTTHAFDYLAIIDREGIIRFVNRVADGMTRDDVLGRSVYDWIDSQFQAALAECVDRAIKLGEYGSVRTLGLGPNNSSAWYRTCVVPYSRDNTIVGATLHVTDVTPDVVMEQAYRQAETQFRAIFDNAAVGIALSDVADECRVIRCNAALRQMLDCDRPDAARTSLMDLVHPDDLGLFKERINRLTSGARSHVKRQLRLVGPQGDLWTRWSGSLLQDEITNVTYLISVIEDLSDLKRTEQRLVKDENLLRRLIDLQDRERQMIAYEIHDGLVQDIIAAQMSIQGIEAMGGATQPKSAVALTHAMRSLSKAINEGRRLIGELRPVCLDERMTIVAAIEFLVHEQAAHGATEISFVHRIVSQRFDPLLENTIFRIVQEALTNIHRHSQADRAEIRFTEVGDTKLALEVRDWGIGFDVDGVAQDRFGIESIRERARLMGGGASIESKPGEGTWITVTLPSLKRLDKSSLPVDWQWTV